VRLKPFLPMLRKNAFIEGQKGVAIIANSLCDVFGVSLFEAAVH
jgi:hypothetical protein